MHGLHLTADLRGCRCDAHWLHDAPRLAQFCVEAALRAGLSPVGRLAHGFEASAQGPGGVTATVLLAESHLCVHTWPERDAAVTLDVYVCNVLRDQSPRAHALLEALLVMFDPQQVERHAMKRGSIGA